MWRDEKTPRKWRKGLIVKLPKKGNLKECENWRGITLLSVVSKVMGRIVIDRIRTGVESKLRKEQASFRPGRGNTEQIFILRNIIEQSIEWQSSLYINFIDFKKVFDSVHRDSLWLIMRSYSIPPKIIGMAKTLYDNFECTVVDGKGKVKVKSLYLTSVVPSATRLVSMEADGAPFTPLPLSVLRFKEI